jgi:folate-dependent tRNA-U54 methylase TrmFO/GidA
MTPFYPLVELRSIPGLENARFEDPYSGGIGNSIRFLAMSPRDNCLKVDGVDNLFCGGEKAGMLVGITEAIASGTLAGHNAARCALGKELVELPRSLCVGDMIAYVKEQMQTEEGMFKKFTFSGSVYFDRMNELGLYTTDVQEIETRVADAGMTGFFAQRIT